MPESEDESNKHEFLRANSRLYAHGPKARDRRHKRLVKLKKRLPPLDAELVSDEGQGGVFQTEKRREWKKAQRRAREIIAQSKFNAGVCVHLLSLALNGSLPSCWLHGCFSFLSAEEREQYLDKFGAYSNSSIEDLLDTSNEVSRSRLRISSLLDNLAEAHKNNYRLPAQERKVIERAHDARAHTHTHTHALGESNSTHTHIHTHIHTHHIPTHMTSGR